MSLYGRNTEDMWDPHISHQVTSHHITTHQLSLHSIFFNHMHVLYSFLTPLTHSSLGKDTRAPEHSTHTCSHPIQCRWPKGSWWADRPHTLAGRRPPSFSHFPISLTPSLTHPKSRELCLCSILNFERLTPTNHHCLLREIGDKKLGESVEQDHQVETSSPLSFVSLIFEFSCSCFSCFVLCVLQTG